MSDEHPSGGGGDHPPPWRWEEYETGGWWLSDATGREIIDDSGMAKHVPADVRALVAAAPEMADLLRYCEHILDREDEPITRGCMFQVECADAPADDLARHIRPCWPCRWRALMKRLDEARKAGG